MTPERRTQGGQEDPEEGQDLSEARTLLDKHTKWQRKTNIIGK
jgi:hypothetical protein